MSEGIKLEFLRFAIQLLIVGILGGAVSWLYSRVQKNREIRISILKEFASLHGRFVSLRFQVNSFHVKGRGARSANHPLNSEEMRVKSWEQFQTACSLIGEFVGLKPLIIAYFPAVTEDIEFLHAKYQDWRRRIEGAQPIFQHVDGKNEEPYNELRNRYTLIIKQMSTRV